MLVCFQKEGKRGPWAQSHLLSRPLHSLMLSFGILQHAGYEDSIIWLTLHRATWVSILKALIWPLAC